jgi:hypothetical protein
MVQTNAMRLDQVSYVTSHDQLVAIVQRLGSTLVGDGVHLRLGTSNFKLPLQSGQHIKVVCPLDFLASEPLGQIYLQEGT